MRTGRVCEYKEAAVLRGGGCVYALGTQFWVLVADLIPVVHYYQFTSQSTCKRYLQVDWLVIQSIEQYPPRDRESLAYRGGSFILDKQRSNKRLRALFG